jgi:hypothetical protein
MCGSYAKTKNVRPVCEVGNHSPTLLTNWRVLPRGADGAGGLPGQAEGPQSGSADIYQGRPARRISRARPGEEARSRRTRLVDLGSRAGMIALGTRPSGGGGIGEQEPGQGPGVRACW